MLAARVRSRDSLFEVYGSVAQLVARFVRNEEVRGSTPLTSTISEITVHSDTGLARPTSFQPSVSKGFGRKRLIAGRAKGVAESLLRVSKIQTFEPYDFNLFTPRYQQGFANIGVW